MGINLPQLGIDTQMSIDYTKSEISKVSDRVNDINIAQKTVNTRGTKELLESRIEMILNPATTSGNSVLTTVSKVVNLKESIEKYNFLTLQLDIKTATRYFISDITNINVSEIIYNNTNVYNAQDGSALFIYFNILRTDPGSWGAGHIGVRFWFKTPTQIYLDIATTPYTEQEYRNIGLISVDGVNVENVTIDPVSYVNTTQGIEDSPVGHIMAYMGKTPPKHYLSCDGGVYAISSYMDLANHIIQQFGRVDFFGGDGNTTFAVPDLRDDFLRGYHGDKTEKLSGDIGVKQESTISPYFNSLSNGTMIYSGYNDAGSRINVRNADKLYENPNVNKMSQNISTVLQPTTDARWYGYESRPRNTSVLYCIKYEPTYYMNIEGLIEETTLWGGSSILNCNNNAWNNINRELSLVDNISNYDEIRFAYSWYRISDNTSQNYEQKCFVVKDTKLDKSILLDINSIFSMICELAFTNSGNKVMIYRTYGKDIAQTTGNAIELTNIVGIKYKTFQKGGTP